jgi:ribose 5-phosphate isomerase RpiB
MSMDVVSTIRSAGISPDVVDSGSNRNAGPGITVPLQSAHPGLDTGLAAYADRELPRSIRELRVVVAADHSATQRAKEVANYLHQLGIRNVSLVAQQDTERLNYGISTYAAMKELQEGRADRVIAFCGNGLGALDIANVVASNDASGMVRWPVYGDNFWTVVDSQEGPAPANVMCLGDRLLSLPEGEDPIHAFVRAFLEAPDEARSRAAPDVSQHGITTSLVDTKPQRVAKRRLGGDNPFGGDTLAGQVHLTASDAARMATRKIVVYSDGSREATEAQKALQGYLPKTVSFESWDGASLPKIDGDTRVILLSRDAPLTASTPVYGFWQPEEARHSPVHRPEHWRDVQYFVTASDKSSPIFLDVPALQIVDRSTGGEDFDLLKFLSKVYLLTDVREGGPTKDLYGEAVDFATAMSRGEEVPAALQEWVPELARVEDGIRHL